MASELILSLLQSKTTVLTNNTVWKIRFQGQQCKCHALLSGLVDFYLECNSSKD